MSIELLKARVEKLENINNVPDWVSSNNRTHDIYNHMCKLETERESNIKSAIKKCQLKKKSSYQISVSELSRLTGLSNPTISHTSAYSERLMLTLNKINDDLARKMQSRIKKIEARLKSGVQASTKSNVIEKLRKTEKSLLGLEKLNAAEQVSSLVERLSLPVKRTLGLD